MEISNKAEKQMKKFGCLKVNGKTFGIYKGHNIIGRNIKARVLLRNLNISHTQAVITVLDQENQFISDLDSVNGTIINSNRLTPFELHPLGDKTEINFANCISAVYHKIPAVKNIESMDLTNFDSQHTQINESSSGLWVHTQLMESSKNMNSQPNDTYGIPDDGYDFSLIRTPSSESASSSVKDEKTNVNEVPKVSTDNAAKDKIIQEINTQNLINSIHDAPTQQFEFEEGPVEVINLDTQVEEECKMDSVKVCEANTDLGDAIHDARTQICEFGVLEECREADRDTTGSPSLSVNFVGNDTALQDLELEEVTDITLKKNIKGTPDNNCNDESSSTDIDTDNEENVTSNTLYRKNTILSTQNNDIESKTSVDEINGKINNIRKLIDDTQSDAENKNSKVREVNENNSLHAKSANTKLYRKNTILSTQTSEVEPITEERSKIINNIRATIDETDSETDVEDDNLNNLSKNDSLLNPSSSKSRTINDSVVDNSVNEIDDSILEWKRNENSVLNDSNAVIPATQDYNIPNINIINSTKSPNLLESEQDEDFSLNVSQYIQEGSIGINNLNSPEKSNEDSSKLAESTALQQVPKDKVYGEDLDEMEEVFNLSTQEYINNKSNFVSLKDDKEPTLVENCDLSVRKNDSQDVDRNSNLNTEDFFLVRTQTIEAQNKPQINNTNCVRESGNISDLENQGKESSKVNSEDIFLQPTQKMDLLNAKENSGLCSEDIFLEPTQMMGLPKPKFPSEDIFNEPTQQMSYSTSGKENEIQKENNDSIFDLPTQKINDDDDVFVLPTQPNRFITSGKNNCTCENPVKSCKTKEILISVDMFDNEDDIYSAATQKMDSETKNQATSSAKDSKIDFGIFDAPTQKLNHSDTKNQPNTVPKESESDFDIFDAPTQKFNDFPMKDNKNVQEINQLKKGENSLNEDDIFAAATQEISTNIPKKIIEENLKIDSDDEDNIYEAATQKITTSTKTNKHSEIQSVDLANQENFINSEDFFIIATQKITSYVPAKTSEENLRIDSSSNSDKDDIFEVPTQKITTAITEISNSLEIRNADLTSNDNSLNDEDFFIAATQKMSANVPEKVTGENLKINCDKDDVIFEAATQKITTTEIFDRTDMDLTNKECSLNDEDFFIAATQKSENPLMPAIIEESFSGCSSDNKDVPKDSLIDQDQASNDSEIFVMVADKPQVKDQSSNDSLVFIPATQQVETEEISKNSSFRLKLENFNDVNDGKDDDSTNSTVITEMNIDESVTKFADGADNDNTSVNKKNEEQSNINEENIDENKDISTDNAEFGTATNVSEVSFDITVVNKNNENRRINAEKSMKEDNMNKTKSIKIKNNDTCNVQDDSTDSVNKVKKSKRTLRSSKKEANDNHAELSNGTKSKPSNRIKTKKTTSNEPDFVNEIESGKVEESITTEMLQPIEKLAEESKESLGKNNSLNFTSKNLDDDINRDLKDKTLSPIQTSLTAKGNIEEQIDLPKVLRSENKETPKLTSKKPDDMNTDLRNTKLSPAPTTVTTKDTTEEQTDLAKVLRSTNKEVESFKNEKSKEDSQKSSTRSNKLKVKEIITSDLIENPNEELKSTRTMRSSKKETVVDLSKEPKDSIIKATKKSLLSLKVKQKPTASSAKIMNLATSKHLGNDNSDSDSEPSPEYSEIDDFTSLNIKKLSTTVKTSDSSMFKVKEELTTIAETSPNKSGVESQLEVLFNTPNKFTPDDNRPPNPIAEVLISSTQDVLTTLQSKDEFKEESAFRSENKLGTCDEDNVIDPISKAGKKKLTKKEQLKLNANVETFNNTRRTTRQQSTDKKNVDTGRSLRKRTKNVVIEENSAKSALDDCKIPNKLRRLSEDLENNNSSTCSATKANRSSRKRSLDDRDAEDSNLENLKSGENSAKGKLISATGQSAKAAKRVKKESAEVSTKGKKSASAKGKTSKLKVEEDDSDDDKIVVRVPKKQPKVDLTETNDFEDTPTVSRNRRPNYEGTPRKSRSNLNTSAQLSTPERAKRSMKHKVVFTMFRDSELEKNVIDLGGLMVTAIQTCTVLVTKEILRTTKLLSAIGEGKPICSPEWIRLSMKENKFLDPWENLLKDPVAEKKWNFTLQESLKRSRTSKLFKGYSFLLLISSGTEFDTVTGAIESCGGKIVSKQIKSSIFIVISTPQLSKKHSKFLKQNIKVVAAEAVFDGVLRQEIVFDNHLIQ